MPQQGVDPDRLGVLGYRSAAGSPSLAAQAEERVGAVAILFGFPPGKSRPAGRLPPTPVLHRAQDRVVPVSAALRLEAMLKRRGIPHEVRIYAEQGHGFVGAEAEDAATRIIGFFRRHLGA